MRCPKCGFVSFDYLDHCLKCNADLTGERNRLNLPGFRPDPISLVELTERLAASPREKDMKKETVPPRAKEATIPSEPRIDPGKGFSLDLSAPQNAAAVPTKAPKPLDLEKELELTLEGLEIKINSDQ